MDFAAHFSLPSPNGYQPAFMPVTPVQSGASDTLSNTSPPYSMTEHYGIRADHPQIIQSSQIPLMAAETHLQPSRRSLLDADLAMYMQNTFDDRVPQASHHFSGFDFALQGFGPQHAQQQQQQQQQQHQHQHHPQQHASFFPGPPTPPNHGYRHPHGHSPATNDSGNSLHGDILSMTKADGISDIVNGQGGSEEEDSLTPAQSRRKAQNRAAQRAFRERKEKHIKDLESKLASLEAAQREAADENDRLRRDLQKMSTENEILRATSSASQHQKPTPVETLTTGPMVYKPTDFYSNLLQNHNNKFPSHRIITSDDGQRLLAAGATWDYVISHEMFKRGLVDVSKVCELIKHRAKCDGQGPVFAEGDIRAAIEQSVESGSDDLL